MSHALNLTDLEFDQADRMRKALRIADIGVGEMAEYLGVHRNSVTAYINGHTPADTRTLRLFAMRTGVPYEWLRNGTIPPSGPLAQLVELRTFNPSLAGLSPAGLTVTDGDFVPLKSAA